MHTLNPIEIFGESLSPLLAKMISEASKEGKRIQRYTEKVFDIYKDKPTYYAVIECENLGLSYAQYWNNRAIDNMSRWYAKNENLLENRDWEDKYDYAMNIRIEEVCRHLYPKGDYKRAKCCPFHKDKTPSFHVYQNTNSWFCFGCNEGGSPINFVMRKNNLNFKEAVKFLYR